MALRAYFDDSGTDRNNPCLVVGGFVAAVGQWDCFDSEIQQLDSEFQAPPFHAQEFERARHGHGYYAAWPVAQRHEYLNRFLGIIGRRCFKSFAVSLEKAAYELIVRPQTAFREYFYSPYVFTAVNAIHAVCEWRNKTYAGEPLLVVFDSGNKNEGQLNEVVKRVLIGSDKLITNVLGGNDETLPPLRAADLLAFELCSESRRVRDPKRQHSDSRYAIQKLDDLPHEWIKVESDALLAEIQKLFTDGTFISR